MLSKEEHIARLIFLHVQGMTDNAQEKELNEWRSVSPRHEELFSTNVVKRTRGKKYFPFRENGRRGGERIMASDSNRKHVSGRSVR